MHYSLVFYHLIPYRLLYGVRSAKRIPNETGSAAFLRSDDILVGGDAPKAQNDFEARTLEAANKIFMCRLLDLEARSHSLHRCEHFGY